MFSHCRLCRALRRALQRAIGGKCYAAAAAVGLLAAIGLPPPALASPGQDYMLYCMGCHGAQAQGVPGKIPPLAGTLGLYMRSPIGRDYVLRVPGAASSVLSDAQLALVLNWVAEQFDAGHLSADVPRFTAEEVSRSRPTPLANVLSTRREVVRALAATGAAPSPDY